MTRVLARDQDFGAKGITVNGVSPGPTLTEVLKEFPKFLLEAVTEDTPQKRVAEVEDIADVVSFLASNESRWVNGQTITAAGGLVV